MLNWFKLSFNIIDSNEGKVLTVTSFSTIVLSPLVFENDDLSLSVVVSYVTFYGDILKIGLAYADIVPIRGQKDLVKRDGVTHFTRKLFQCYVFTRRDAVLFSP